MFSPRSVPVRAVPLLLAAFFAAIGGGDDGRMLSARGARILRMRFSISKLEADDLYRHRSVIW